MAIWYWDPKNGNNANDGTSFANRKLTLQSLTSATAGDTIRCIKSQDATALGQDATWTDNSNTVALTSAVTQLVASCDTNWTASVSVTCSATAGARKDGTNCQQIAIAAGFTTGKAAYFATGALDLSAYQQLTFWIRQTAGTVAVEGDYTLRLCSDTAGATVVNEFPIPPIPVTNKWMPITVDLSTALGASIGSISFGVLVDRAAVTFQLDNINACLPSTGAYLSLNTLISKNTNSHPWLGIQSINGTSVILDQGPNRTLDTSGTFPTYNGTTETVPLYFRLPISTGGAPLTSTAVNQYAGSTGADGNPVTISGGWNDTDMSTQTGDTYLDGINGNGLGISWTAGQRNLTWEKINVVRYNHGVQPGNYAFTATAPSNYIIRMSDSNNNDLKALYITSNTGSYLDEYTIDNACNNGNVVGSTVGPAIDMFSSSTIAESVFTFKNVNSNVQAGFQINNQANAICTGCTFNFENVMRNSGPGIYLCGVAGNTFNIGNCGYNFKNTTSTIYKTTKGNIVLDVTYEPLLLASSSTVLTNVHDNLFNIGNLYADATYLAFGLVFGTGANNNKVVQTGTCTQYASTNATYYVNAPGAGTNYITSPGNPFGLVSNAIAAFTGTLYVSLGESLDFTGVGVAITNTTRTGSDGKVIIKNIDGVSESTIVYANGSSLKYWGR